MNPVTNPKSRCGGLGYCAALSLALIAAPAAAETPAKLAALQQSPRPPAGIITAIDEAGQVARPRDAHANSRTAADPKRGEVVVRRTAGAAASADATSSPAEAAGPVRREEAAVEAADQPAHRKQGGVARDARRDEPGRGKPRVRSADEAQIRGMLMREARRYLRAWQVHGASWQ